MAEEFFCIEVPTFTPAARTLFVFPPDFVAAYKAAYERSKPPSPRRPEPPPAECPKRPMTPRPSLPVATVPQPRDKRVCACGHYYGVHKPKCSTAFGCECEGPHR